MLDQRALDSHVNGLGNSDGRANDRNAIHFIDIARTESLSEHPDVGTTLAPDAMVRTNHDRDAPGIYVGQRP